MCALSRCPLSTELLTCIPVNLLNVNDSVRVLSSLLVLKNCLGIAQPAGSYIFI